MNQGSMHEEEREEQPQMAMDEEEGLTPCGKDHAFCTVGGGQCKLRQGHVTDHVCDKCGKKY